MTAPTEEGFYWAKWMISDGPEGYTPFKTWEPVEVYFKDDGEKPGEFMVWMMGHDFAQPLDCFHWGERLSPPIDKAQALRVDQEKIKADEAAERFRKMTLAQRIEHSSRRRTP